MTFILLSSLITLLWLSSIGYYKLTKSLRYNFDISTLISFQLHNALHIRPFTLKLLKRYRHIYITSYNIMVYNTFHANYFL